MPPPGPVLTSAIAQDRDRTTTGLLLMIIAIGLSWVPFLSIIGALLALIALIILILGRWGYGPAHHRNVVLGGVLYLITVLASIGLAVGLVVALFGQTSITGSGVTIASGAIRADFLAFFVGIAIVGILGGLVRVILVYALADRTTALLLWTAFALSVAFSIVILVLIYPQIATAVSQATSGTMVNSTPLNNLQTTADLLGLVNGIPSLLFMWAYYRARNEAIRRSREPAPY